MLDRNYIEEFNSPIRQIKGKAEVFNISAFSADGNILRFDNVYDEKPLKVKASPIDESITDLSSQSVRMLGKNLYNIDAGLSNTLVKTETGYKFIKDAAAGSSTFTGSYVDMYIPANTTVTFSMRNIDVSNFVPEINSTVFFQMQIYSNDLGTSKYPYFRLTEIKEDKSIVFTVTYTHSIDRFRFYTSTGDKGSYFTFDSFQVEIGGEATEYEAYKEQVNLSLTANGEAQAKPYTPTTTIIAPLGLTVENSECNICDTLTLSYDDRLRSIEIVRQGEQGKFFGFGVTQKAKIKLLDKEGNFKPKKGAFIKTMFAIGDNEYENTFPSFYIKDVSRDEKTNEVTIDAEDLILYSANNYTFSQLDLVAPYTIGDVASKCASLMGLLATYDDNNAWDTEYVNGANFDGAETIREILDDIAEATQTLYYVDGGNLIFTTLNYSTAANIEKQHYFSLESKEPYTVGAVCHITELGDNVTSSSFGGVTQYVRDNGFWELREDIGEIVESAAVNVAGISITPFTCSWRGNFLVQIGDKLLITAKDNSIIETYLLNDTITYNGGFKQSTQWEYAEDTVDTANPNTLGEKLKQTFARVDKANKQIEIVASESSANSDAISSLIINTGSISASVVSVEKALKDGLDSASEDIADLANKVEAQITAEDVTLTIKRELESGVGKVETSTGYRLDEEGLTVSKSDSEISTQITDNGMKINKGTSEVLTASNEGVKAQDLHATTFLIIGNNSRFEDMGNRTACFWIGGK